MLTRLAWRNLWRNRSRTLIVTSAISFSFGLMLFMFGLVHDAMEKMGDNVVEAVGGHVLIHGEGYWELPTGGQTVDRSTELREHLESTPQVEAVSSRVLAVGLLGTAANSEAVLVQGIDPEDDRAFIDLSERLIEGELLSDDRRRPIVVAAAEAERLGLEIGDRVVVTASDIEGDVTRGLFFVDGILESTPGEAGEGRAYATLEDMQETLGYGSGVTQIGIRLVDDDMREAVAQQLREHWEGEGLEVMTWSDAVPEFEALIEMRQGIIWVYLMILVFIVVLGITNTFMMAVMERIRELGLLSALGLEPRRIGALVMLETVMVAAMGMGGGLLLGLAGHAWISRHGYNLGATIDHEFDVSGISMDMVAHSQIHWPMWAIGAAVVFVFICLAALYPAYRATQQAPSEAMRFYE